MLPWKSAVKVPLKVVSEVKVPSRRKFSVHTPASELKTLKLNPSGMVPAMDPGRVPELVHEMQHQLKKQLLVTPEVALVDYGHLPRSERKSQRIFDNRLSDDVV